MAKKINSIVLAKAILADLKSNRLKANELFMTDDGGYEISVGELRRFLRLAVESGKLRERIAELEAALGEVEKNLKKAVGHFMRNEVTKSHWEYGMQRIVDARNIIARAARGEKGEKK